MAIARLSMKVGKMGKAGPHAAYIVRAGKYAKRLELGERLEATDAGNMPAWAAHNPLEFWQAADIHERKNGTTYREMEIALPREITLEQRVSLVREFVDQEIGDRHAYQWAIHTKPASDGGEQPHVHLMFSERQRDGIERDPEQYFKRYNSKVPKKGGARKGYGASAGQTLTKEARADELKGLRGRWADMCNLHLGRAGYQARIDMRSYEDQGTDREPERKQLPSEWRGQGRANVIEFRKARAELADADTALSVIVPDIGQELHYQDAVEGRRIVYQRFLEQIQQKEAREKAARQTQSPPTEAERYAAMSSRELAQEIHRLRPEPVEHVIECDQDVIEARRAEASIIKRRHAAERQARLARKQIVRWREAHRRLASLHDAGIWRNQDVQTWAAQVEQAEARVLELTHKGEDAALVTRTALSDARMRATITQAPAMGRLTELESLRQAALERERRAELDRSELQQHDAEAKPKSRDRDGGMDFSG